MTKEDLENIVHAIEVGYDLSEHDINIFQKTRYVKKYQHLSKNILLIHLKKPIANQTLFFYYKRDYGKEGAIYYSRNPW